MLKGEVVFYLDSELLAPRWVGFERVFGAATSHGVISWSSLSLASLAPNKASPFKSQIGFQNPSWA